MEEQNFHAKKQTNGPQDKPKVEQQPEGVKQADKMEQTRPKVTKVKMMLIRMKTMDVRSPTPYGS